MTLLLWVYGKNFTHLWETAYLKKEICETETIEMAIITGDYYSQVTRSKEEEDPESKS